MTQHHTMPGFAPDPTIAEHGSPNLLGPKLPIPRLGIRPETPKPWWYMAGVVMAQMGLFIALLGPATLSIQLKADQLASTPAEATTITSLVLAPGALVALVFNVLGGRISDRTTSRFGRRRPWIVIGIVGLAAGLLLIAIASNAMTMLAGWVIAQATANLAFAAFLGTLSDQLPAKQYGTVSGLIGMAQNLGVLAATWLANAFTTDMLLLFMVPAAIAMVLVIAFALMLPEPVLARNRHPFNLRELAASFWRSLRAYPDFALAWAGKFLIVMASFMFVSFRLQYMRYHLGLDTEAAASATAIGVTVFTVTSVIAGIVAGRVSDLLGRRKVIVAVSILVFGIATFLLAHADTVTAFYVVEAVMGVAYGAYVAVDLALVLEVLPNREEAAKDLGVFNIASALPQSLAPAVGGVLLVQIGGGTDFTALLVVALGLAVIGAVLTMFIRGVK